MHHIDAKRFFPALRGIADGQRADIADDGIDAAEFGGRAVDPALQGDGIADIDALPPGLHALGGQRAHHRADLGRVARADRDIGPFICKQLGDREANAFATAGDQHPFAA